MLVGMFAVDQDSEKPIYRQLFEYFTRKIESDELRIGDRLPATRELAGKLGLNRTTVSAAYELLEGEGWITGEVGRGSFVRPRSRSESVFQPLDWNALFVKKPVTIRNPVHAGSLINFSNSRPAEQLFPLEEFRAAAQSVLQSTELPSILQLGSPGGYEPLRQFLLESAQKEGVLKPGDDLMITNGCQQALDLIRQVLICPGDAVALEDPVYPGLRNVFQCAEAELFALPVGFSGLDVTAVRKMQPKLVVVTPCFQNPTGTTMSLAVRESLLAMSHSVIVENDLYSSLRYSGTAIPTLKQLDQQGSVILIRSFSKVAFPGLRVGWVVAPKPVIQRLVEAKALADLHTDHFSQAVLLEFVRTGRLETHLGHMLQAGAGRLSAMLTACEHWLPAGSRFTRPEGGMNIWLELPDPLDTSDLLARAQTASVAYWPGKYFSVAQNHSRSLRLSFAGVPEAEIEQGVRVLGSLFEEELERERSRDRAPVPAMV